MKRTILTPERKAVREAQESKWFDGYAGAATSWPYRVKRYLSKELSDKIRAEVQAKCDEWVAKLETIHPSRRLNGFDWCDELKAQCCWVDRYEENAIPTEVLGHKIYVKILTAGRTENSCRRIGIKAMEKPKLEIGRISDSPNSVDGVVDGEHINFAIGWCEEKQRYFVAEYHSIQTESAEITSRYAWKAKAHENFMNKITELEDHLIKEGVQIGELKKTDIWIDANPGRLKWQYVDCTGPEVMA